LSDAPKNNHGWASRFTPRQKVWWEAVLVLVKDKGGIPSMMGLRRSWDRNGLGPCTLPSEPTLREAFKRAMRESKENE
jgi:hypothetical protein